MSKKEVSNSRVFHRKTGNSAQLQKKKWYFHLACDIIPSLTLCRAKNSHNPSIYQGCGCFHFCIDMYYF